MNTAQQERMNERVEETRKAISGATSPTGIEKKNCIINGQLPINGKETNIVVLLARRGWEDIKIIDDLVTASANDIYLTVDLQNSFFYYTKGELESTNKPNRDESYFKPYSVKGAEKFFAEKLALSKMTWEQKLFAK